MGETVLAGDLSGSHDLVLIFLHGVGQQGMDVVNDFTTNCGARHPPHLRHASPRLSTPAGLTMYRSHGPVGRWD
jgi:predicted esterase